MALRVLLGFVAAYSFCLLVLAAAASEPHQAFPSRQGFFGRKYAAIDTLKDGICASSVIVHGYKCQEFEVTTKDGYILSLQRIPEGRAEVKGSGTKKEPVIIQHGVLVLLAFEEVKSTQKYPMCRREFDPVVDKVDKKGPVPRLLHYGFIMALKLLSKLFPDSDGMTWLLNPPEQGLPFILADNRFDVWIANTRGTRYSRRHTSLNPTSPDFWNWSWDELVTYDLPAVFNYVFSQTGQKINYVGHSQGTLIALASFSEGNLVKQLKSAALLSPIAYLSHMNTALGVVAAKSFVGEITSLFGLPEFNPKGLPVAAFINSLCAYPGVDCYDLLTALTGKNCCLNSSTVDLFLRNEPQPTSTKNMVHLAQTVRHGVLAKFNYERPDYNIMHYGEAFPPIYNLSNIPHNLPLFVSYGGQDALSDVLDVGNLLDSLKFHDVDKLSVQFIKDYAHADYIMGVNAKDIVYDDVLAFFKRRFDA